MMRPTHAEAPMAEAADLLEVRNLTVRFNTRRGSADALDDVSFSIPAGTNVGLVGESGCGKSTLMKAIIGVLAPNAELLGGSVRFRGVDLVSADVETVRRVRWTGISMIAQSALNALNPVQRVGDQITEAIHAHVSMSRREARRRAEEMLKLVGVDPKRFQEYPHQFSGGMRQRAIIAMALVLEPKLVLADEPTTSLDMIVQHQIFQGIRQLRERLGFSMLLVTHDLGVVIENCSRIAVMYSGRIVEEGPIETVVGAPFHPYTLGLKNSLPRLDRLAEPIAIPGSPPDPVAMPKGCRFARRCPFAVERCISENPKLEPVGRQHKAACHRWKEIPGLRGQAGSYSTWSTSMAARELLSGGAR